MEGATTDFPSGSLGADHQNPEVLDQSTSDERDPEPEDVSVNRW
jgi:hypothetical protein